MTEIEQKALALVNEVIQEVSSNTLARLDPYNPAHEAVRRAIEQHEQFKRDVSDAVEADVNKQIQCGVEPQFRTNSVRFILPKPKPDPLVEVMNEMGFGWSQTASDEFRHALAKRNARIVWEIEG